jgi:hypothetical protein
MSKRTTQEISAGAALEREIRKAVPPGVEFDEREAVLLAAAANQADDIAALERDIRERSHMINGAVNPAVREARQARLALARLLSGIDLPGAASTTTLRAEKAARARCRRRAVAALPAAAGVRGRHWPTARGVASA